MLDPDTSEQCSCSLAVACCGLWFNNLPSSRRHPSFDSVLSHAADAVVIPAGPNYNYLQRNLALELVR